MSTTTTNPNAEAPVLPSGSRVPTAFITLNLIPAWLLWTVIFWENWVNLRLDAPYTGQFLSAPIFVAMAKFSLLLTAAVIISFPLLRLVRNPTNWKDGSFSLLRNWLDCWFLSTVSMVTLNLTTFLGTAYKTRADNGANPDPFYGYFANSIAKKPIPLSADLFTATASLALYTLSSLAVGLVVYACLWLLATKMRNRPAPAMAITKKPTSLDSYVQWAFILVSYSLLNGFFAALIRT
jgi:hypothetical protein